ncbi:hypothetical protein LRAMOSA01567 [Lichtheimia ramosa]|uniref:Uncharacterized protein n=1 Tax=Lichtheimia ramosa TaxID=688394 RepID=A0A077WKF3_9FUNG|nr:hypothetical protein LRAMOSA01567 [Lichtheimia ramosa]
MNTAAATSDSSLELPPTPPPDDSSPYHANTSFPVQNTQFSTVASLLAENEQADIPLEPFIASLAPDQDFELFPCYQDTANSQLEPQISLFSDLPSGETTN